MIAAEVINTNLQPPNPAHEGTKPRTSRTGRSGWSFLVSVQILAKCSVLSLCAADPDNFGRFRLASYRAELERFRNDFGGSHDLPDEHFFLFGLGLRTKLIYRSGALIDAQSGVVVHRWDVVEEVIVPPDYAVHLRTRASDVVGILEDEHGVWIEERGQRTIVPGTTQPVRLPDFKAQLYSQVLRVLHQELLVNVTTNGPVPNVFVYGKPWYRDGAMMALAFKRTGNLDCIRDWVLGLREPYDRNNGGETEADNLGQALFLVSLASDTNHPLVAKVLAEIPKLERQRDGLKFIQGRSDFSEHPAYQTKWLKLGLRALGLPDDYTVPRVADGYSALFWMDFKDNYVAGKDSDDRGNYPYLGWACDHFHGAKKSPIGNRDYPLTWEARASQAHYEGIQRMSDEYARLKLSAPHTWHAAEVFLYLLEQKAK